MTFRKYIETLYYTHLFGKNRLLFARELFCVAITKPDSEPAESTINSWYYKGKRSDIKRYFQNGLVDKSGFIDYFKKKTKDHGSWKIIQDAFSKVERDKSFRVDLETENCDVFFWSLLNQFQRIFGLDESEWEKRDPPKQEEKGQTISVAETLQDGLSPKQMREWFLDAADRYRIMEIINKKPAIYGWIHSAYLNLFLKEMDPLILNCARRNDALCASIISFINSLYRKAEILERNLSKRFDFEDETASFNMENDNEVTADSEADLNSLELPKLSDVIKAAVADIIVGGNDNDDDDNDDDNIVDDDYILNLLKLDKKPWGAFRREMCTLYDKIFLWQDKL